MPPKSKEEREMLRLIKAVEGNSSSATQWVALGNALLHAPRPAQTSLLPPAPDGHAVTPTAETVPAVFPAPPAPVAMVALNQDRLEESMKSPSPLKFKRKTITKVPGMDSPKLPPAAVSGPPAPPADEDEDSDEGSRGLKVSAVDCFKKALEMNDRDDQAWGGLACAVASNAPTALLMPEHHSLHPHTPTATSVPGTAGMTVRVTLSSATKDADPTAASNDPANFLNLDYGRSKTFTVKELCERALNIDKESRVALRVASKLYNEGETIDINHVTIPRIAIATLAVEHNMMDPSVWYFLGRALKESQTYSTFVGRGRVSEDHCFWNARSSPNPLIRGDAWLRCARSAGEKPEANSPIEVGKLECLENSLLADPGIAEAWTYAANVLPHMRTKKVLQVGPETYDAERCHEMAVEINHRCNPRAPRSRETSDPHPATLDAANAHGAPAHKKDKQQPEGEAMVLPIPTKKKKAADSTSPDAPSPIANAAPEFATTEEEAPSSPPFTAEKDMKEEDVPAIDAAEPNNENSAAVEEEEEELANIQSAPEVAEAVAAVERNSKSTDTWYILGCTMLDSDVKATSVFGSFISAEQCLWNALCESWSAGIEAPPFAADLWYRLSLNAPAFLTDGEKPARAVHDQDAIQCLQHAITADKFQGRLWQRASDLLPVINEDAVPPEPKVVHKALIVNGVSYTKEACADIASYTTVDDQGSTSPCRVESPLVTPTHQESSERLQQKQTAVEADAHDAKAWYELGCAIMGPTGRAEVNGVRVSAEQCLWNSLCESWSAGVETPPFAADLWYRLALIAPSHSPDKDAVHAFDAVQCLQYCITADRFHGQAWAFAAQILPVMNQSPADDEPSVIHSSLEVNAEAYNKRRCVEIASWLGEDLSVKIASLYDVLSGDRDEGMPKKKTAASPAPMKDVTHSGESSSATQPPEESTRSPPKHLPPLAANGAAHKADAKPQLPPLSGAAIAQANGAGARKPPNSADAAGAARKKNDGASSDVVTPHGRTTPQGRMGSAGSPGKMQWTPKFSSPWSDDIPEPDK